MIRFVTLNLAKIQLNAFNNAPDYDQSSIDAHEWMKENAHTLCDLYIRQAELLRDILAQPFIPRDYRQQIKERMNG